MLEPTIYALRLSVEAFIEQEKLRPVQFRNENQIRLAKRFLDRIKLPPFSEATTIAELKKMFEKELEILSDNRIGEQLSFFPTPATNLSIARIDKTIAQNIRMYQKFIDACDYKELVAPRFYIIDKHTCGKLKVIEIWLIDSLGVIPPERYGWGPDVNSLEYRVARGFAKDKLKSYYPNGVNPRERFPQFPQSE